MTFRSIVCPVDFSTHSRHALRHAAAVAHRFDSRMTVMFVTDPLLLAAASSAYGGRRKYIERTKAELERFVKDSVQAATPSGPEKIALVVNVGNPAEEILREAKRRQSDLIVIGTGGLTGIQRFFFGSTTEQVLRRTTLPVLAIPPAAARRRTATAPMTIRRVLAPIDLSGEWQSDAIRAADVARTFDAELALVHVLAPIQAPPWLRMGLGADRRRRNRAATSLERVRARFFSDLESTSHVLAGNPAHEIAALANTMPSLLVMSLRGTAGVWGARRGSIAYHVLTHTSTSLLALPRRRIGGRLAVRLARAVTGILSERDRIEIAGIDAVLSAFSSRKPIRR